MNSFYIIGYSGHAYVVCDIFLSNNMKVSGYFDNVKKESNPFQLEYLGNEQSEFAMGIFSKNDWFVAIGHNGIRKRIVNNIANKSGKLPLTIFHNRAIISKDVKVGAGSMIAAGAVLNPIVKIGKGVICNTGSIIEHNCVIDDFVHIAPGAVLAGGVTVGKGSFIGANAVIKEGVNIGSQVNIGAGSVILKNVSDNLTVVGNPGRILNKK